LIFLHEDLPCMIVEQCLNDSEGIKTLVMEVCNMLCTDMWECVTFVYFCSNCGNETCEGHKNDM
jgi:hypothetical protein